MPDTDLVAPVIRNGVANEKPRARHRIHHFFSSAFC